MITLKSLHPLYDRLLDKDGRWWRAFAVARDRWLDATHYIGAINCVARDRWLDATHYIDAINCVDLRALHGDPHQLD